MTVSSDHAQEPEVLLEEKGALGRITLNRPRALNSLTLGMVRSIAAALDRWESDGGVRAVLVEGAGDRGLCAGGDIRALYDAVLADDPLPGIFWREEYRLNARLARYPKPVVGLMDGICMGGGVGVSAHGSHRVVTERSKVGMPEVGIGFTPDVGGVYLLSRAPGELGTHMALTGAPVGAGDAIHCGFADVCVASSDLEKLVDALASGEVDETLADFAQPAPVAALENERPWIDAAYSADSVEEILRRLRERPEASARTAVETIGTKSPTSLKVTLRALRSAARMDSLEQVLDQDLRVALGSIRHGDFVEGVRAALVDKDRDPKWSPDRLEDVTDDLVDRFFRSAGEVELGL